MTAGRRDDILARIRAALGDRHRSDAALVELQQRISEPPVGPRPGSSEDPLSQFMSKAQANLFTLDRIASLQMLVPAIRSLLPEDEGRPDISVAPALRHLGWPSEWSINFGAGRKTEALSVTLAIAGIAETGSVVLRSDGLSPTTLNFLPDTHVVVLRAQDVVSHLEDAWARLRSEGKGWPRTVNVIAGPSRTADVGGIIVRPAHGPKSVHLVLCDS